MIRTDDGMRGRVELVEVPGFENQFERRIVYVDRGEKRIAGKREVWEVEKEPPKKLREEEMLRVAGAADLALRAIDRNEAGQWWRFGGIPTDWHDPELKALILGYLEKRG